MKKCSHKTASHPLGCARSAYARGSGIWNTWSWLEYVVENKPMAYFLRLRRQFFIEPIQLLSLSQEETPEDNLSDEFIDDITKEAAQLTDSIYENNV